MSAAKQFTLTGRHVLAGLLVFFGAVIAVNVAFAVAAVRSFPGEDVRRSYLQGLAYNDTLADRRAQEALGWQAAAAFRTADDGGAVLEVVLRTRDGAPLNGAQVNGELRRAATARFDRELSLTGIGEGRYTADLGGLETGRWLLRARAADAQDGALDFEAELTWSGRR
jgi:nitrogen fixation protein FixH